LQQEAQPLTMRHIVRLISRRIDGIKPNAIYQAVHRLEAAGAIDREERAGLIYYAHHGVALGSASLEQPPEQTKTGAASIAIRALLEERGEAQPLRAVVKAIMAQIGTSEARAYAAVAKLTKEGSITQEERDGQRYVGLVERSQAAPAVEEQPAQPASSLQPPVSSEALHVPTLHPSARRLRPEPFDPASAYAPEAAPEPPALPDTPHFIDCDLTIAGLDIHARITLDLPNSIAREATFRYLVRVISQLERITGEVLNVGAMAAQAADALQLAQEEEQKRRLLEERHAERLAQIARALRPEDD
jgi:hypothetical protein